MDDPWVPSIGGPALIGNQAKEYPAQADFASKGREAQTEILVDAIVQNAGTSLDQILKLTGATRKQFYDITSSDDFPKRVFDRTIQEAALTKLPHVVSAVVDGAVLGQDQKIKMFLQMLKCVDKDETTINVSLQHESVDGLRNRLENLMDKVKSLDSQERGAIIDVDAKQITQIQDSESKGANGDIITSEDGREGVRRAEGNHSINDSVVVGGSVPRQDNGGSEEDAVEDGFEDEDEG